MFEASRLFSSLSLELKDLGPAPRVKQQKKKERFSVQRLASKILGWGGVRFWGFEVVDKDLGRRVYVPMSFHVRVCDLGFGESGIECMASGVEFRGWGVGLGVPGEGNSNSHGARPVHQIISMIKWIRTSKLSMQNCLSLGCLI